MSETSQANNKRIAKNTLMLYVRMLISMAVGLYTSRVVLEVLGVEDYGVYNVVGGVVAMLGFLNAAMSGATSRFITFELGSNNKERLKLTFSSCLAAHLLIAGAVFVLSETIGLWFVNNKLVIPVDRMLAANIVYQCSVISMLVGILKVPFSAEVIAHEKMGTFAYIELLLVFLKLALVLALILMNGDKLILYAFLLLTTEIITYAIYVCYDTRHFIECKLRLSWNKDILKPMLSFSLWNVLNEIGFVVRVQGSNIVINRFFGVILNAATGIASTVQGVLSGFSSTVVMAYRPQVIKSYSVDDIKNMERLMGSCIRISLSLLWLITIPIFAYMDIVLDVWLKDVPEYSSQFCRLSLLINVIATYITIITIGIHATGKLKWMCIITNICYLCIPLIQYVLFKLYQGEPAIAFAIVLLAMILVGISDTFILKRQISQYNIAILPISLLKTIVAAGLTYFVWWLTEQFWPSEGYLLIAIKSILVVVAFSFMALYMVLGKTERTMAFNFVKQKLHRQ